MKGFIGLVLGAIAVGVMLVAGAITFGRASRVEVTVHPIEPIGVTRSSVDPSVDRLGIRIEFTIAQADVTTVVLQRSVDDGEWTAVATFPPGSTHHTSPDTIVFLDEDVEHEVTYTYQVQLSDTRGGSGQCFLDSATASDPSR